MGALLGNNIGLCNRVRSLYRTDGSHFTADSPRLTKVHIASMVIFKGINLLNHWAVAASKKQGNRSYSTFMSFSSKQVLNVSSHGICPSVVRRMLHGSLPATELELQLPWAKIAAQEWKAPDWKKQVLMLHGWQDNSNTFKKLVPLLPKDWWMVAIDFPGHGFSDQRVQGLPYHAPDYLIDVKAVIDKLGWKNYSIIGHSMGAGVAQGFASCFPDEIDAVVCIDMIKPISAKADTSLAALRRGVTAHLGYDPEKDTKTYSRDEAIERWFEATAYTLTKESVEILMERGVREVEKGRYVYTRDRRLQFSSLFRYSTEQHLDILKELKSDLMIIKALDTPQFEKHEIEEQFLHLFAKNCKRFLFTKVAGTHHLHLNTPENVAPVITEFLQNQCSEKVVE